MAGHKFEEAAIAVVEDATRAHTRNQKTSGSLLGWCEEGENKGGFNFVWPRRCSENANGCSKIRNFAGMTILNDPAEWPGSVSCVH
jgi:hypothetical protein